MKILHTVEFYHPRVGGAERVVQNISEGLAARGHDVTVATSFEPTRREMRVNGVRIVQFPVWGNEVKGIRGAPASFCRFLEAGGWDVVMNYAAQSWPTDLTMRCLGRLRTAKVLAPCGYSGLAGWRRPVYHGYYRQLPERLRQYDAVVCHSAGFRDYRFGERSRLTNQVVIPNGVDAQEFGASLPSFREVVGIGAAPLVVSVGNHYRLKGHGLLFRALRSSRHPDAVFAVIGNDPGGLRSCQRSCKARAKTEPRWRILGGLPRPLVVAAIREADAVVSASRTEVFPLSILEAMAAARPFVAMDAGIIRSLPGGIVCDSSTGFIKALDRLIDDAAEARRLGEEGRKAQRARYDWSTIVEEYEVLYEGIAGRRTA